MVDIYSVNWYIYNRNIANWWFGHFIIMTYIIIEITFTANTIYQFTYLFILVIVTVPCLHIFTLVSPILHWSKKRLFRCSKYDCFIHNLSIGLYISLNVMGHQRVYVIYLLERKSSFVSDNVNIIVSTRPLNQYHLFCLPSNRRCRIYSGFHFLLAH